MENGSTTTASQLLSMGSSLNQLSSIDDISKWFAECLRWATLEGHDDMEVDSWLALKQIESLDKRTKWLSVLRAYINAIINIQEDTN